MNFHQVLGDGESFVAGHKKAYVCSNASETNRFVALGNLLKPVGWRIRRNFGVGWYVTSSAYDLYISYEAAASVANAVVVYLYTP